MPQKPLSRYAAALNISQVTSLSACINELQNAIEACENEVVDPTGDVAVGLIALRIVELLGVGGADYQRLQNECVQRSHQVAALPPLLQIMNQPVGYDPDRKDAFRRESMALLRRVAKTFGLETADYRLCFNHGGIAISGVATLHMPDFFVQISQSVMINEEILYRTCDGLDDNRGGRNHFAPAAALCDPLVFAKTIHKELGLTRPFPASSETLV